MSYKKPFLIIKLLSLILIVSAFYSCDDHQNQITELSKNRQLWESKQISSYIINESLSCYCGGVLDWELRVEDEIKIAVNFDESQLPSSETYETILERARTINNIFDFIESLENQDTESLEVQYNSTYGFPISISVDYNRQVADDEFYYSFTNFNLLD